ncbi:5,6-dimethylbenzimidazole synthase [Conexibacter sp. W3-3-2]|uniref:5,6-dimethylbenzimidazole synthase n=1 Tax=Conexibacter sp. W3-3-2 TaxID=2675227 RepID=UPI0012B8AF55|nr:5,6-dimethylbenzimidazole synthase [Conexibacter sp. W3-3-2]MTD45738.1 5,6-dimethylbenzimidazole synthase [Conexibacter sp. W3-3-2]
MSRPPSSSDAFVRPPTPAGFDPSRAAERAADPRAWRFADDARAAVHAVIEQRRDIRRFRPDAIPDDVLERVLTAGHRAPSVGLMQPTRFVVVRDRGTRSAMRTIAQRERLRQAERFDERAGHFLDQKIEGVVEAPIGLVVCCDRGEDGAEVFGRGTIPETDVYSTACAIQNVWLAARAEGLGVGWVSFYRPDDLRELLGIPARVEPMAWLCLGWPDERPVRPGLEAAGWAARLPLRDVVMEDRWDDAAPVSARARAAGASSSAGRDGLGGAGPDVRALVAARDRFDELVTPTGSLGALHAVVERWASITGAAPPAQLRAGVLVAAADHGHVGRGTSLFDGTVSGEILAATGRGETAVAVLCAAGGHRLLAADVGLRGPRVPGVRDLRIADGTADLVGEDALSAAQLRAALEAGATLVDELADAGVDCVVLGEIGIGNTTTAAALAAVLGVAGPERLVGRGTGSDHAGIARKRAAVEAVLTRVGGRALGGHEALRTAGGLELAALAGATARAAARRLPVVLDGYAASVSALCAVREEPLLAEHLIAGHRSAEPAHGLVLAELGLEPLLDLRLRLGEASGALLALPLIAQAGRLHREMGAFRERP